MLNIDPLMFFLGTGDGNNKKAFYCFTYINERYEPLELGITGLLLSSIVLLTFAI